jgi:SagB-type dehydrogenase family enzyme
MTDLRTLPHGEGFRDEATDAWTFHRNTCRWNYNASHPTDDRPEHPREHEDAPFLPLPPSKVPLAELAPTLGRRLSCRAFADTPITLEQVAALTGEAYGVSDHVPFGGTTLHARHTPSAGGLYPLELYLIVRSADQVPSGVHHYHPVTHGLEHLRAVDIPARYISYLFMNQAWFSRAAAIAVFTGVPHRTAKKYGDRAYRYLLLEAGHAAQNLVSVASALRLGTCCGGGFFDDELAGLLLADIEQEVPIYAVAIGTPATEDPATLRITGIDQSSDR